MFKCVVCNGKKIDSYCCETNISICLDCCVDDCGDSSNKDEILKDLTTVWGKIHQIGSTCPYCDGSNYCETFDDDITCIYCDLPYTVKPLVETEPIIGSGGEVIVKKSIDVVIDKIMDVFVTDNQEIGLFKNTRWRVTGQNCEGTNINGTLQLADNRHFDRWANSQSIELSLTCLLWENNDDFKEVEKIIKRAFNIFVMSK